MATPTKPVEKPACLLVCSSHSKGVSAHSFITAYTSASANFNVFIATPEGKTMEFVDLDDGSRQWLTQFKAKPIATPTNLDSIDGSKFIALVIPSCPGALFDLATNRQLASILYQFVREKKPLCAVGFGVAGLFSAVDKQSQQWAFKDYSMTAPSLMDVAKREDFGSLPIMPADHIRKLGATYSSSSLGGTHVVVDDHLVTGQDSVSTIPVIQNLFVVFSLQRQSKQR
ncbi:hypothetical protein EMCRGX_G009476 [Ephydatia muelleri]|eukprot:Em0003g733a